MNAPLGAPGPLRRFRRRLLVVMLAVGLLPTLAWGLMTDLAVRRLLSLTFRPIETLLDEIDAHGAGDPALAEAVGGTRLHLAQAEAARGSLARLLPRVLAAGFLVSALVLILAAELLGRRLSRPVEQLTEGMARYARGDLDHRLPEDPRRSSDELQYLIQVFNRMGDQLAAQRARLEVTEALAAWQGVARALAHELKNPLTAMRMAVARLLRAEAAGLPAQEAGRREEALSLIESQIGVLQAMAESFSGFARLPAPVFAPTDLAALVGEVCALYRHQAPAGIELRAGEAITVAADRGLLTQAVGNLVKNAIEASTAADAPVQVQLTRDGERVRIDVIDAGPGIPAPLSAADLARSMGTTKAKGSGLGLPIAQKIVHEHGGSLRLEPLPARGTRATILIPLPETAVAEASGRPGR